MTSIKSSKKRFEEFFADYQKRKKNEDSEKDESEKSSGKDKKVDKKKRKAYLRLYINRLWPHWGAVLMLLIFSLIIAGLDVVQPLFVRYIVDQILLKEGISDAQKISTLNLVGGIFLAFILVSQFLGVFKNYRQRLLNAKVILTLRRSLYDRMIRLPLEKLSDMKTGGIISRLTDDVNTTTGLLQMAVISPSVAAIRLLVAVGILFVINWKLALTAIGVIPCVMLMSMVFLRRIRPIYRAIRKDVSEVDGRVGEAFQGIRAVRTFQGEQREELDYAIGHHTITRKQLFAHRRQLILWTSWGFLLAIIGLVIVWYGGYMHIRGTATIGDIMAFQVYIFMLLNPVWQIVESFSELQRSMAAMERVFEVLETEPDKPDQPDALDAPNEIQSIEFRNVSFAYEEDKNVIHNLDLKIQGGSVVALVGRSGAGKTTITDLAARFYDPTDGEILLNGLDLKKFKLQTYRELLGIVQQEVFLFDGTVSENIAYGKSNATLEQIREAAIRANAHEFIDKLPEGYDSIIGERGVKLSGGQRQRLSIARSILADPAILILDEATSNLDTESEQLIQKSMNDLLKDRTTFVIAHRLSTISSAHLIVVLDEGRIVESGSHDELMKLGGTYFEMVNRQNSALVYD